jgi:hypothetical protein
MRATSKGRVTISRAIRNTAGQRAATTRDRGRRLVTARTGRATSSLTMDQIMALTRR